MSQTTSVEHVAPADENTVTVEYLLVMLSNLGPQKKLDKLSVRKNASGPGFYVTLDFNDSSRVGFRCANAEVLP